jgi:hypothetical protein
MRSPKSEIRNPKQLRSTKLENIRRTARSVLSVFALPRRDRGERGPDPSGLLTRGFGHSLTPILHYSIFLALLLSTLNPQLSTCLAQGTAFTYQGRLNDGANPATGIYDLRLTIYDLASAGNVVAGPITNSVTGVSNGLFTVTLDFGTGVFTGPDRWLEIAVRTNGGSTFSTNVPRQQITPTPYAIYSGKAMMLDGTVASNQLEGTYSGSVTFDNPTNMFTGKFAGDGGMLTNINAGTLDGLGSEAFWKLLGNGGTTVGVNFLGTTDDEPLELKVNNVRALRLEYNGDGTDAGMVPDGAPNLIGGSPGNFVPPGIVGATIAGGGATNYLGLPSTNSVLADYGTIGGGVGNRIQGGAYESTIGGGGVNTIQTNASRSTIGGGENNTIYERFATIGGGDENLIFYQGIRSTIGGGTYNTIQAGWSTISGGTNNTVESGANCAAIGGGLDNTIQPFSEFAAIGGGNKNNIGTNSDYSAIGGGYNNSVGAASAYVTITGGNTNNVGTNSAYSAIGGGNRNNIAARSSSATIAGGSSNDIGSNSTNGAIGGGENNTIGIASAYVTIAGGHTNEVGTNSTYGAIGGGDHNRIEDNSLSATIAGGTGNIIGDNSDFSVINGGAGNRSLSSRAVIGGGQSNVISLVSSSAVIAGGNENTILVSASYSTIGGGRSNLVDASAPYSCIPGGRDNVVDGDYAFASGRRAKANHSGTFVWADSQDADFASTAINQVSFRCDGGVRFTSGSGAANQTVSWTPGSASWSFSSDRELKENIRPVDGEVVLAKLARLPISEWNYEGYSQRHLGPMAQDFHAQFPLNTDDKSLNDADLHGVALAAIQGLNEKVEAGRRTAEVRSQKAEARSRMLEQKLEQKEAEISELKERLERLEQLLAQQSEEER